jgi:site-specific recombinase
MKRTFLAELKLKKNYRLGRRKLGWVISNFGSESFLGKHGHNCGALGLNLDIRHITFASGNFGRIVRKSFWA